MTSLADIVVVAHAIIAAFIALGFVLIPVGSWFGWRLVRRWWLRFAHLVGILFVAGETVLGLACPLTLWENQLRQGRADNVGFVAGWVRWVLYYDVPLWIFGVIYVAAAAAALMLWYWVPPTPRR